MDTIELWESEITNQPGFFENICESIDIIDRSIELDFTLYENGIITEASKFSDIRNTVSKKIKELIKAFKRFIKELISKVRAFIQKQRNSSEEKVFDALCKRIEKLDTSNYTGTLQDKRYDKYRELCNKYNEAVNRLLKNFTESRSMGDTFILHFCKRGGHIYDDIDMLSKRIKTVSDDIDYDSQGKNNSRGSVSVSLGVGAYLNDDTYVDTEALLFDSTGYADNLIITNDMIDKSVCNTLKDLLDKSAENVDVVYDILDKIDKDIVSEMEKLGDKISKSNIESEANISAYKMAVGNIKTSITKTRATVQTVLDKSLAQDAALVKIRRTIITLFNKII